jgi:hypothetical protein
MDIKKDVGVIRAHQTNYINRVLKDFKMDQCNATKTPAQAGADLAPTEELTNEQTEQMKKTPYRSAVGSLMHAAKTTVPKIALAVNQLTRFFNRPEPKHWEAVKRVMRYLRNPRAVRGLIYSKEGNPELLAYVDSDWGQLGYMKRRSVSGFVIFLAGGPVSWQTSLQKTPALSSCEAEYMALSEVVREICWLRMLLAEMGFEQKNPTPIFIDNEAAVWLAHDDVMKKARKHIDIKYHYTRFQVEAKKIDLIRVNTKDNVADVFTKATPAPTFTKLTDAMDNIMTHLKEQDAYSRKPQGSTVDSDSKKHHTIGSVKTSSEGCTQTDYIPMSTHDIPQGKALGTVPIRS